MGQCLSYLHTRVFQKARRIRRFTAKGFGKYSHGCWPKFLVSMAKVFPHIYVWGFCFYFAQRAAPRPCRAASLFNNQQQSKSKSLCHGYIKLSNINLFISTCRYQSVYVNMSISTCLYQIVKSTCLNHLLCHSFDITSSASLLLPTCVWRDRDGTWWPRQILVSPATERSARFCVCACQECSLARQAQHLVALGIHLCRQCPRVLVCGRDSSSRGRRSIELLRQPLVSPAPARACLRPQCFLACQAQHNVHINMSISHLLF